MIISSHILLDDKFNLGVYDIVTDRKINRQIDKQAKKHTYIYRQADR